ncbi:hypothetical protein F4703DRAFT_1942633 [Phycomyces blakesleeanus]
MNMFLYVLNPTSEYLDYHKSLLEEPHFLKQHVLDKTGKPIDPKLFYKAQNGLVMFSAKDNKNVLVASPLLWIEADTSCHSELCGLCMPQVCTHAANVIHTARTKAHYLAAAFTSGRGSTIPDAPLTGNALTASNLCFANRATDALLELQSFNPSTDTPVEVLHNILLGVAKYLVNDLVKVVLKKNSNQMARLSKALKDYENSQGIAVRYNYNIYINKVEKAVTRLIQELHHYVITCEIEGHNPYSSKPKVHLLTHLPNDLQRFGTALHYKTEKGEQFNKHIREHLMYTNRLNISRDVCLKFTKQSAMRHIIDDDSWVSKDKMREKYSNFTAEFLKENFNDNVKNILFGGSREFADNNNTDDITTKALCDNTFVVFMLKESRDQHAHPFIGKVPSLRIEYY